MKLKVAYNPHDGPHVAWDLDPGDVLSVEAELIEEVSNNVWQSYGEFWRYVDIGNIRSWRALLWMLLRRSNPQLAFQNVIFKVDEFSVEIIEEEPPKETDATGSPSPPPASPPDSANSTDGQLQSSTQPVPG